MGAWPPAMQGAPFPRPVRSWALGGRPRRESVSPAAALGSGQPAGRRAGPGGAPGPGKMLPHIAGKGLAFGPRGDVRGRLSSQQQAGREMRLRTGLRDPGVIPLSAGAGGQWGTASQALSARRDVGRVTPGGGRPGHGQWGRGRWGLSPRVELPVNADVCLRLGRTHLPASASRL